MLISDQYGSSSTIWLIEDIYVAAEIPIGLPHFSSQLKVLMVDSHCQNDAA